METVLTTTNRYWKYLEGQNIHLNSEASSRITTSLENTSWDNPITADELNNFAVMILIEAEQCQDRELREVYFEVATEALKAGIELCNHPLCNGHLALTLAISGENEKAFHLALSTFINVLQPTYIQNQSIASGIIYLPSSRQARNNRFKNLAEILQAENGYTQALLLLSEVLCYSQLVFYNTLGLRFLSLASQLFSQSVLINLRLGIASLINRQTEGIFYLHRAQQLLSDSARAIQSLYLAYRDIGKETVANDWLKTGQELSRKELNSAEWQWTGLAPSSSMTYVPFEDNLLLTVEASLRSLVTSVLLADRDWFEREMEFWRDRIKPGMTVIDVGANVGVYTFSAARRVGEEGCVLAIEPFSGCVHCLQETCHINNMCWVKVCAGAASDRNGTVRLALHSASELNEIVSGDRAEMTGLGSFEEVDCFTLDSLAEREKLRQVDFLKIDAEGHELQVLQGSQRILKAFAPIILYENIAGAKGSNIAVSQWLMDRGYRLFRYQPYLRKLLPLDSLEQLSGHLNLIAVPANREL